MIFHRFRQFLTRLKKRFVSETSRRKLTLAAMIGIFLLLAFSLYMFSMDLITGYTQEKETFILQAQIATSFQTEAPPQQKSQGADEIARPAAPMTPQDPATPSPVNSR